VPSLNMASNSALAMASRSGASRRGRQVTGGPGVVRMWWKMLWRTSRWTPVGSERTVSAEEPPLMTFKLGVCELAAWAGANNDVTASSRRLFLQSTRRPKWDRKSAPMRGCVTSATTNRHVNSLRNGSAFSRAEVVVDTLPALWNQLAGEHAEVRACVNQESQLSGFVGDEEAAGSCSADFRRC
jgi:hypothetical protein